MVDDADQVALVPKITIELDVDDVQKNVKPLAVIFSMDAKSRDGEEGFNLGGAVVGEFPVSMHELNRSADVVRRIFFKLFAPAAARKTAAGN